jgi:zinc protease
MLLGAGPLARAGSPDAHSPAAGSPDAGSPASPLKIATVEGITEYRLANGLRVLLFPDPGKPSIIVNVTYMVGSRNEHYGETGMAHLLEHLLFKGTPDHPHVPDELTAHGARFNGSTECDRTNYFETFQADGQEANLAWALGLESDRMVHSNISQKDLWDKEAQRGEMTVVRNEMEMGENDPFSILAERVQSAAYEWHAYGKDTIGARSDVENVDIQHLQAFYHTWYQPDNATLLVAGRIDEARTLALVSRTFGAIPRPARTLQATYTVEPTQDGERLVTLRRTGESQWALAAYHVPAGSDPDFAPLEVLGQLLGDEATGRLHRDLVASGKAGGAFAMVRMQKEPGLLEAGAMVRREGDLGAARDVLVQDLEAPAPFTAEEVDRARQQLLKGIDLALKSTERVGLALSEYIALGDWRMFFLDRDRIQAVTPADVQRVAKAYLKSSNRTLGLFLPTEKPDRAEIPAPRDVEAMVKDYKGRAPESQGELFDTAPAAIEAGTRRFSTAAGLKVAMVPRRTRGAAVHAEMVLHFGDEVSLRGRRPAGSLTAAMLMRGSRQHTRIQIQDALDRLKAQVNVGGNDESATLSVETVRENLTGVLELVAEVLKDPAFPGGEFQSLKEETLAWMEDQLKDPSALAQKAFARRMSPYPEGHPRFVQTLDQDLAELKAARLEDLAAFHKTFYGASAGELALVGDFDPGEARALVDRLFGGWKAQTPYVRMARLHKDVPAARERLETPDKQNACLFAGQNLPVSDEDPAYPALVLGDFMLGGGSLNSRLAVRIRQKEGLSYGVGSYFSASQLDHAALWGAYAIFAPQNAGKVESAFLEEFNRALKDGFTPAEIEAAKRGWLEARKVARAQDNELAMAIDRNMEAGRTLAYSARLEAKVQALTGREILEAMDKYLDPARLTLVMAGDFHARP